MYPRGYTPLVYSYIYGKRNEIDGNRGTALSTLRNSTVERIKSGTAVQ